jgi:hypothetical protein
MEVAAGGSSAAANVAKAKKHAQKSKGTVKTLGFKMNLPISKTPFLSTVAATKPE